MWKLAIIVNVVPAEDHTGLGHMLNDCSEAVVSKMTSIVESELIANRCQKGRSQTDPFDEDRGTFQLNFVPML
jgi:hypothetical protein